MLYLLDKVKKINTFISMNKDKSLAKRCVLRNSDIRKLNEQHSFIDYDGVFGQIVKSQYGEYMPNSVTDLERFDISINNALFSNVDIRVRRVGSLAYFSKEVREKILKSYKGVEGKRVFSAADIPDKENVEAFAVPEGYDAIAPDAFSGCPKLKRVLLPKGLKQIGDCAFFDCPMLTTIEMPKTVEYIGGEAFNGCKQLHTIKITKSKGKEVEGEIHLPDKLAFLGLGAFADCESITSVEIPENVTNVLANTFNSCKQLRTISLPQNLQTIGDLAFVGCTELIQMHIPDTVTELGHFCFAGCSSLNDLHLSTQCKALPINCFQGCRELKKVEIPKCVKSIGDKCFDETSPLLEIEIMEGNKEDINISETALPESTVIKELKPRTNPITTKGGEVYDTIESPKQKPFARIRQALAKHRERTENVR